MNCGSTSARELAAHVRLSVPEVRAPHLDVAHTRRWGCSRDAGGAAGVHCTDQCWGIGAGHRQRERVGRRHTLASHKCHRRHNVGCAGGEPGDGAADSRDRGSDAGAAGRRVGAKLDFVGADGAASGRRIEQNVGGGGEGGVRSGNDW
jgi:hypothetical protein